MQVFKTVILCNNRMAIPAIREIAFYGHLAALVVPAGNDELEEELRQFFGTELPLITVKKDQVMKELKQQFQQAEVGLIMTFPFILAKEILDLPKLGFYNFHYGLLPEFRGPEPIFSQVKTGEGIAGVSVHKVTGEPDAGPICLQEKIQIGPSDTHGVVQTRLAFLAADLAVKLMKLFGYATQLPLRPQDESKARWFKKPALEDVMIDWDNMSAKEILHLVNACNPWNKGAGTRINNYVIGLLEVEILDSQNDKIFTAGSIVSLNSGGLIIASKDKQLLKANVIYCPEGFMSGQRLASFGIKEGDRFS